MIKKQRNQGTGDKNMLKMNFKIFGRKITQ